MKYVARVGDHEFLVEIRGNGTSPEVLVDGRPLPATLAETAGGACLLAVGASRRCVDVRRDGEVLVVTLGAREFRVDVEDERERAAHAVRPADEGGPRVVRSVMPGIVRKVLVAEGDRVEARAPLLVLEAMKMQNEVRADREGLVVRVHVEPGSAVARGDALVSLQ